MREKERQVLLGLDDHDRSRWGRDSLHLHRQDGGTSLPRPVGIRRTPLQRKHAQKNPQLHHQESASSEEPPLVFFIESGNRGAGAVSLPPFITKGCWSRRGKERRFAPLLSFPGCRRGGGRFFLLRSILAISSIDHQSIDNRSRKGLYSG